MSHVAGLKVATAIVAAATVVVTGGGLAVYQVTGDEGANAAGAAAAAQAASPKDVANKEEGAEAVKGLKLTLSAHKTKTVMRPDGKNAEPMKRKSAFPNRTKIVMNPDGSTASIHLTLTLTNVTAKPISLYPSYLEDSMPGWLPFQLVVIGPDGHSDSTRIDFYDDSRRYLTSYSSSRGVYKGVPAKIDPMTIASGKQRSISCPIDFSRLWRKGFGRRSLVPGVYRLKMKLKAEKRRQDRYWHGTLVSNELILTVEAAATKQGRREAVVPRESTARDEGEFEPFKYVVDQPAVAEFRAGKHPENCLVITVRSVATVPVRVGGRHITCKQEVFHDRIEVTPIKAGEPHASSRPELPEKVTERALMCGIPLLNLADGETFRILLNFAGQKEELALSYDDETGLRITPVKTRYLDASSEPGKSYGTPFRQLRTADDDTQYCVSNLSLAARRDGKLLWQAPTSKWFLGYPYLPESIELDGEHIVLRTLVPKAGMSERTEPFEVRFSANRGAVVSSTLEKIMLEKERGPVKQGDPDVKRQLEREGEER